MSNFYWFLQCNWLRLKAWPLQSAKPWAPGPLTDPHGLPAGVDHT